MNNKLKLLKLDNGKNVIDKKWMDEYFVKKMYSLKDFKHHFGIGHRVYKNSREHWYTQEQLKRIRSEKATKNQIVKNSNSVNFFKPRNLIELEKLQKTIKNSKTKKEIKEKLGISDYILKSNMRYYNLKLKKKRHQVSKDNLFQGLNKREILRIKELSILFPDLYKNFIEKLNNDIKVVELIDNMLSLSFDLRILVRKLKRYQRNIKNHRYVSNIVEYQVSLIFDKKDIDYIPQFNIGDYYYDFLLVDYNTIIELDGNLHNKKRDKLKDKIANENGYLVKRIKLDKKENEKTLRRKLCLRKIKYPKLKN